MKVVCIQRHPWFGRVVAYHGEFDLELAQAALAQEEAMFRKKSESAPPDDHADTEPDMASASPVVPPPEAPAEVADSGAISFSPNVVARDLMVRDNVFTDVSPATPPPPASGEKVTAAAALVSALVMRCRDGSQVGLAEMRKLEADIRALA